MKIIFFGGTDVGKKRSNNEDAYLIDEPAGLYAVADGIGGSEGGEVASRIAVDSFAKAVREEGPTDPLLRNAVALANDEIRQVQERRPELGNMGTTLDALLVRDGFAWSAHIGDSRIYLLRSGELKQLTHDHSLVAEQVEAGVMTAEQASVSPYRHVITRALGSHDDVLPDVEQHPVQGGDKFLLCTDGLTEMLDDASIREILVYAAAPREAVQQLLAAANEQGGVDNVTAVAVWIVEV